MLILAVVPQLINFIFKLDILMKHTYKLSWYNVVAMIRVGYISSIFRVQLLFSDMNSWPLQVEDGGSQVAELVVSRRQSREVVIPDGEGTLSEKG